MSGWLGKPTDLVGAEIAQPKRSRIDDEEAEDPVTLGQMTDGGIALGSMPVMNSLSAGLR
jgi:hypothetical protein